MLAIIKISNEFIFQRDNVCQTIDLFACNFANVHQLNKKHCRCRGTALYAPQIRNTALEKVFNRGMSFMHDLAYRMAGLPVNLSQAGGHFCFKPLQYHNSGNIACFNSIGLQTSWKAYTACYFYSSYHSIWILHSAHCIVLQFL